MRNAIAAVYLAICAVQDLRWRKISLRLSAAAGCAAAVLDVRLLLQTPSEMLSILGGLLPGAFLFMLALAADGAAGTGDGICFLILGGLMGAGKTWVLLLAALFCAGVGGGLLMVLGKAGKKTKLPFLTIAAAVLAVQTAAEAAGIL